MRAASYRGILAIGVRVLRRHRHRVRAVGRRCRRRGLGCRDGEAVGSSLGGPHGVGGREVLPLTDEERAQVFDGVMRTPGVPVAEVEPPEDAAPLPGWVALQELPIGVAQEIPLVDGYKFVKLDDRILLVNPDSRKVVAEMPRYKLVLQSPLLCVAACHSRLPSRQNEIARRRVAVARSRRQSVGVVSSSEAISRGCSVRPAPSSSSRCFRR